MTTKKELYTELEKRTFDFFRSLDSKTDVCINDYINISDLLENLESNDAADMFEDITDTLQDNGAFDLEIIYYSNAIEYLKENDPSLNESLSIAIEYGFSIEKLNSGVLASLLYSQNETEKYYNLRCEIIDFFEEIKDDIDAFIDEEIDTFFDGKIDSFS